MAWYDKFIEPLGGELGVRPARLLQLVFAEASQLPSDPLVWRVGKDAILRRLAEEEGGEPLAGTIRARVHQINQATRTASGGRPAFALKSRKDGFEITLREGAADELARQEAGRLAVESSDADAIADSRLYIDPTVYAGPREFQVFVSHAHESPEVEEIVRGFIAELARKLRYPPSRYKDLLRVSLWLDHDRMGGGRSFADQAHPECERSELCLFLLSEKFYQSKNCQAEVAFFADEADPEPRHMQVQLCGSFADAEPRFRDKPCYPLIWRPSVGNLLRAWELNVADRDEFLTRLRDDILSDIARRNFPGGPDGGAPSVGKRGGEPRVRPSRAEIAAALLGSASETRFEDVIDCEKTEAPAVTREEGSGETESAVDLLADWACSNSAGNRVFALLGSFGAGKTTASQLFVRELLRRRELDSAGTPVPVYLDLRRLNEVYLDEKTRPSLAEMIRSSLRSNVKSRVDADQLLAFLRKEPCVVVFDGLDEIGTRIGIERLASLYRELLEIIPNPVWEGDKKAGEADWAACPTRILVTCRTHFFRTHVEQQSTLADRDRHVGLKGGRPAGLLRTIYMAPFTLDQIQSYFCKELGAEEGKRVWQSVARIGDLAGLATRPIMARYIAELSPQLQDDLARGRTINAARVYDHLFEKAVERDNDKKPLLKPRDRARLLEELAEELWLSRVPSLSIDALEDWFDRYCEAAPGLRLVAASRPEARGLLQTELRNANLLVRAQEREFRFVHTSFQEYFLARRLKFRLDKGALEPWPEARLPSHETLHFLLDLYAVDQSWPKLRSALERCLAPGRPGFWRQIAVVLRTELKARGQDFALPEGADLSALDLRGLTWPRQRLARVDLRGANLLGCEFTDVEFDGCRLDDSNWANSLADTCSFNDCTGRPSGLASARFGGCTYTGGSEHGFEDLIFAAPSSELSVSADRPTGRSALLFEVHRSLNSAVFGKDGTIILTAGGDGTARLLDAATGAELRRFEGHQDAVWCAAFSGDDRMILTGGIDGTARLWNSSTGQELRRFDHEVSVFAVAFGEGDQTVLIGGGDGIARLFDTTTGAELRRFEGHADLVRSVAFSPDGRTLLTAANDGTARLWDAVSGIERHRLQGHVGIVSCAVFSSDGRTVLTAGGDATLRLWDAASGAKLRRIEAHGGMFATVLFGAHDETLISAGDDGTVRIWSVADGSEIFRLEGHRGDAVSAALRPGGRTILTAGTDGTVRLWDATTGIEQSRHEVRSVRLSAAVFSADGRMILTAGGDETIRIWDSAGTELHRFKVHEIHGATFSEDGGSILTAGIDGTARLLNAATGAELRRFEGHAEAIRSAVFGRVDRTVLTAGDDGTIRLWDVASGAELRRFEGHDEWIFSAVFGPDDRTILSAGADGTARLWDTATGAELRRFEAHDWVRTAVFGADGRTILTAGDDGTSRLWDVATGAELRRVDSADTWTISAAFGQGDGTILTAGDDGVVRLWDSTTGAELRRFDASQDRLNTVAVGEGGRTFLTAGYDGTARLWDSASGELLYALRPFPDGWVRLDAERRVVAGTGKLWKYVYGLAVASDGGREVVNPWQG